VGASVAVVVAGGDRDSLDRVKCNDIIFSSWLSFSCATPDSETAKTVTELPTVTSFGRKSFTIRVIEKVVKLLQISPHKERFYLVSQSRSLRNPSCLSRSVRPPPSFCLFFFSMTRRRRGAASAAAALAAVLALALFSQGVVASTAASTASSVIGGIAATTTTATAPMSGTSTNANILTRRLLRGIPACTLEYLPGCPEVLRTVSGKIVNGGGATVFLRGTPFRQTALPGSYNLSTVASANGDYAFSGIYRGRYDIEPTQAGFSFTPSSVTVEVAGADATAPSITRNPL